MESLTVGCSWCGGEGQVWRDASYGGASHYTEHRLCTRCQGACELSIDDLTLDELRDVLATLREGALPLHYAREARLAIQRITSGDRRA